MDNTRRITSYFEQLPNEFLLDLFENYIRLIDVYIAFYLLNNRRINGILNSARFYIDLSSKDIFHLKSFSHFAPQIVSLNLSMFCHDLDLSKLINLRSLHIEKPTRIQLVSIRPEILPHLYYLSLSPCWYTMDRLPKHLTDLSQSCHFNHLRLCILPNGEMIRLPLKLDQSSLH